MALPYEAEQQMRDAIPSPPAAADEGVGVGEKRGAVSDVRKQNDGNAALARLTNIAVDVVQVAPRASDATSILNSRESYTYTEAGSCSSGDSMLSISASVDELLLTVAQLDVD